MKKKKYLILFLVIAGIALIATGFFLSADSKNKDSSNDNTTAKEGKKYPYSGVYDINGFNLYVYQNNEKVYFAVNSSVFGQATIENNIAKGYRNGNGIIYEYTFTLINGKLQIQTNDLVITSGTYDKIEDITIEKYFNNSFGKSDVFNTKYNGFYQYEDKKIMLYQSSEKEVTIIASSDMASSVLTLDITDEENTLTSKIYNGTINVTINDGKIVFKVESNDDTIVKQFEGEYSKVKSITLIDVIANNTIYY